MNLDILNTHIRIIPRMNPGKKDRRFKTGYRILPFPIVNTELSFEVSNTGYLRIGMVLQSVEYGKFIVIAVDNLNRKADLKMTSMADMLSTLSFTVPKRIEVLVLGSVYREGSCG